MKLTLIKKQNEVGNAKTFTFKPEEPISWQAGQYLIYNLEHKNKDLRGKMRFFTISSPPYEKYPTITTRIYDKPSSFKKALNNLNLGDKIDAKGPDGDFIIEDLHKSYIFIARGIGITPFHSILKQLKYEKKNLDILLLYSNKDENVVFKKELDNLKLDILNIKYFIGEKITQDFIKSIRNYKDKFFYVSGPEPMVASLEETLDSLGIAKKNQYYDYFSGYKNI